MQKNLPFSAWHWERSPTKCERPLQGGRLTNTHKNTKRSPYHAMPFDATLYVLTFLHNYTEENAILLPGRIPGYKQDNIKLLPSTPSKAVRNREYVL